MEELIINLQELLLPRLILDNQCFIGRWHVAYRLGRKPFFLFLVIIGLVTHILQSEKSRRRRNQLVILKNPSLM
jgi:hypothetical protein